MHHRNNACFLLLRLSTKYTDINILFQLSNIIFYISRNICQLEIHITTIHFERKGAILLNGKVTESTSTYIAFILGRIVVDNRYNVLIQYNVLHQ